jgi:hypothetical protein
MAEWDIDSAQPRLIFLKAATRQLRKCLRGSAMKTHLVLFIAVLMRFTLSRAK